MWNLDRIKGTFIPFILKSICMSCTWNGFFFFTLDDL